MDIFVSNKIGDIKLYYVFEDGSFLLNDGIEMRKDLDFLMKSKEFTGSKFQLSYLNSMEKRILFIGLGNINTFDDEILRKATSEVIRYCNKINIKNLSIDFNDEKNGDIISAVRVIAEASILTSYKYDEYLSRKIERSLSEIYIKCIEDKDINEALEEGVILGKSTNIARDLVNEPANIQNPEKLGKNVESLGQDYGFEVELFYENEIIEMGMNAFYEVSKGSNNKPLLIVMRYMGDKDSEEKIGLIGKGITYDSGGLNLKKSPRFIHMKHDMAGSAAVIGAMCAIADQGLKINVIGIVASCENMISSKAYKPGDIINSMANKSILINSTDAEGRLTLIDAIHYGIEKENIDKVVNIATLTGAARVIIGNYGGIVMSNDEDLYQKLETSSSDSGERTLRLPIIEDAKVHLKSNVADYINTSTSTSCKAITAGMLIGEFVQNKPWIHIDMSGPCWSDNEKFYTSSGGTGWGTRLLYSLIKKL